MRIHMSDGRRQRTRSARRCSFFFSSLLFVFFLKKETADLIGLLTEYACHPATHDWSGTKPFTYLLKDTVYSTHGMREGGGRDQFLIISEK